MTFTLFSDATIFDGRSDQLLEGHYVLIDDNRIAEVGRGRPSVAVDWEISVGGRFLMPGLIDLHTHSCLNDVVASSAIAERTEIVALYAARAMRRSLARGFTTLRDAGGGDAIYVKALDLELIDGPRFYPAGRFITMTGGHGDMRDPHDTWPAPCCGRLQDRFVSVADGADEVRRAVREELRRGATQVKIFVSGGVMSPNGNLDGLQYTAEEIMAAVETAEAQRRYVMAHCHTDVAIRRAAECGVRSIEHCSFIGADTAALMAERGAYAVPTLAVGRGLIDNAERLGLPAVNRQKMASVWEPMMLAMETLARSEVKVGFGSDVSGQLADRQGSEFTLRSELFSAHQILLSATSVAAEILQEEGNLGVIAPGALADIIIVDDDPLRDIKVLDQGGTNIPVIMKDGTLIKNMLAG